MAAPRQTRRNILVIEDDDIAREGLAQILRHEGYDVATLTNGKQGLDYLRAGPRPDLIFLDMLLPVLDGWKFLEALEHWSKPLNVPIVVATGTILTPEWAAQHGCAGFLRKPIEPDRLLEQTKRLLAEPAA
jgi:CheY-like chemotaxis protein